MQQNCKCDKNVIFILISIYPLDWQEIFKGVYTLVNREALTLTYFQKSQKIPARLNIFIYLFFSLYFGL